MNGVLACVEGRRAMDGNNRKCDCTAKLTKGSGIIRRVFGARGRQSLQVGSARRIYPDHQQHLETFMVVLPDKVELTMAHVRKMPRCVLSSGENVPV